MSNRELTLILATLAIALGGLGITVLNVLDNDVGRAPAIEVEWSHD